LAGVSVAADKLNLSFEQKRCVLLEMDTSRGPLERISSDTDAVEEYLKMLRTCTPTDDERRNLVEPEILAAAESGELDPQDGLLLEMHLNAPSWDGGELVRPTPGQSTATAVSSQCVAYGSQSKRLDAMEMLLHVPKDLFFIESGIKQKQDVSPCHYYLCGCYL